MRQIPKRQSLNLRIKPEERGLIDRAAKTLGKNRTDFVLDAARCAAAENPADGIRQAQVAVTGFVIVCTQSITRVVGYVFNHVYCSCRN